MKFKRESVLALKAELEETGYANDEQGHGFGSVAYEHHIADIFSDLREVGYEKQLEQPGGFFEASGALYWIFDPEMTSRDEAQSRSEDWASKVSNKRA